MSFSPDRVPISGITQANPAVVTTGVNHNLTTGQVVRLHVPSTYGMVQLNQRQVSVTVLTPTTFSIQVTLVPPAVNIDSTQFVAFTTPTNPQFTAEVLPIGSGPTPITTNPIAILRNSCDTPIADATVNISTTPIPF